LLNINQNLFKSLDFTRARSREAVIWSKLIDIARIEANALGDMILVVDSFREPIRELLF